MELRVGEKLGTLLPAFTFLWLFSGVLAQLQMPQSNVEVIQGQMAVLQAYYVGGDISQATVIWNMLDKPIMVVPPALPVCVLQGKPVLKANVTLSCHSSTGKPAPKYKWSKTSPSSEVFFSPMLNETAGTLKLNNLSSNMTGKYECTSSNSAGEGKCYINLEVITSTDAGVIAGATVGAVVGFVLIVLFIIFLWTRRKDTEEDLANDIKEDAQAPKRVSWAKSGTGSDIISKNGTLSSVHSSPHPRDTHNHYQHNYPHPHATSDTASIITATGSTAGYRPRPIANLATPERTLPGYNTDPTLPRQPPAPPSSNGGSLPRTEATPTADATPTSPPDWSQHRQHLPDGGCAHHGASAESSWLSGVRTVCFNSLEILQRPLLDATVERLH
ncbi:hypothetical protein SRHO_G00222460 [Serrasalmus rhombeus]